MSKKAVILLSGGLDSATCLAIAKSQGYDCYVLSFDYGQRSHAELNAAECLCQAMGVVEHKIFNMPIGQFGGSALTDTTIAVPGSGDAGIPITYVPARNTVFLAIALAYAEVLGAHDIFIGANAVDYSGYPDCRPEFIEAFQQLANVATKAGVEGQRFQIHAPLMQMNKSEIIQAGLALGVDYSLTCSCYQATDLGLACGECDSCYLRAQGFIQLRQPDPTRYVAK